MRKPSSDSEEIVTPQEVNFENIVSFVQQNIANDPETTVAKVIELYGPKLANPYDSRRHKATVSGLLISAYLLKMMLELKKDMKITKRKVKKQLGDRLKTSKTRAAKVSEFKE